MRTAVVSVYYDDVEGAVGLNEALPDGTVSRSTYVTTILTRPRNGNHHPGLVKDPTPWGLTNELLRIGINLVEHVNGKFEMMMILNRYG